MAASIKLARDTSFQTFVLSSTLRLLQAAAGNDTATAVATGAWSTGGLENAALLSLAFICTALSLIDSSTRLHWHTKFMSSRFQHWMRSVYRREEVCVPLACRHRRQRGGRRRGVRPAGGGALAGAGGAALPCGADSGARVGGGGDAHPRALLLPSKRDRTNRRGPLPCASPQGPALRAPQRRPLFFSRGICLPACRGSCLPAGAVVRGAAGGAGGRGEEGEGPHRAPHPGRVCSQLLPVELASACLRSAAHLGLELASACLRSAVSHTPGPALGSGSGGRKREGKLRAPQGWAACCHERPRAAAM